LHVKLKNLTAVTVKRLDVWISTEISRQGHIVSKDSFLDCTSHLIIEVNITELRVDPVDHQTYFTEVIVLYYQGECLSDIAAATMNFLLKRVVTCSGIVAFKEFFDCKRVI